MFLAFTKGRMEGTASLSQIPSTAYRDIQRYQMETGRAFLRRVQNVIEYLPDGSTSQHKKGGFPYDKK